MMDTVIVLAVIAGFAGLSFGVACFSFGVSWYAYKNTKMHYDMNQKYISAQIIMEMLNKTDEFREINDRIGEENIEEYKSDEDLGPFLSYLEYLGGYYRDGLVTHDHVENTFGALLEKMKKDDLLEQCYRDLMESDKRYFKNLKYLIGEIVPPSDSKKE